MLLNDVVMKRIRGLDELREDTAVARSQAPLLGWREVRGQGEGRQILERATQPLELGFELRDTRRQRGRHSRPHDRKRRAQKLAALRLARRAIGVDERQRFAGLQAVRLNGRDEGLLVAVGHQREGLRQRGAHRASRQPVLRSG